MKRDEVPYRMPGHRDATAAATAAFATLPYPIAKEEAARVVGDWAIPVTPQKRVALRDVLAAMPVDDFETPEEALNALDAHWGRVVTALNLD